MDPPPYPRPDFARPGLRWLSLDGPWDFVFDDDDIGLCRRWGQHGLLGPESDAPRRAVIRVPFVFQYRASGVDGGAGVHEVLWYQRRIPDLRPAEDRARGCRLLLRFGAVDYEARVWVDGRFVGAHRGGHVPFDLDVTDAVDGSLSEHRLTVRVYDSVHDLAQSRGKQFWGARPEGIFYTPSSGIWQSVWLEVMPPARIADSSHETIVRSDDIESGTLSCHVAVIGWRRPQRCCVEVEASFAGVTVATSGRDPLPSESSAARIELGMRLSQQQLSRLLPAVLDDAPLGNDRCWRNGVALWSPEHPLLYDVAMRLFDAQSGELLDEVRTQAGMRSIDWCRGDGLWRLNGRPYFQALCLDQGYWPDSLMTPPYPDSTRLDIELAKRMGFNGCRKHQKVEDPLFSYWSDRLGYLVWAEAANAYHFSPEYVDRFNQVWTEVVRAGHEPPVGRDVDPRQRELGLPVTRGQRRAAKPHARPLPPDQVRDPGTNEARADMTGPWTLRGASTTTAAGSTPAPT